MPHRPVLYQLAILCKVGAIAHAEHGIEIVRIDIIVYRDHVFADGFLERHRAV